LECGVALKVRLTTEDKTIDYMDIKNKENFPLSVMHMLQIAQNIDNNTSNIIEVNL